MVNRTGDLGGKIVVVAGAAGAAGPATVRALTGAGAGVVALGHNPARLQDAVAGTGASAVVLDLLDEEMTRACAEQVVADHGRVDGLIHLVGGWRGGTPITGIDLADWLWLQARVVQTLQVTSKVFHDPLAAAGGRLAVVSTPQARTPTATNACYAAAKAAAEAWTLAVADSWAGTDAAAVIFEVNALLTPAMRADRPDAAFAGYTRVEDLAEEFTTLWDHPGAEVNGTRRSLIPG